MIPTTFPDAVREALARHRAESPAAKPLSLMAALANGSHKLHLRGASPVGPFAAADLVHLGVLLQRAAEDAGLFPRGGEDLALAAGPARPDPEDLQALTAYWLDGANRMAWATSQLMGRACR